jgi:hypothetical protein
MRQTAIAGMDGDGKHRLDSAYRVGAETAGRSLDSTGKQQKCRMKRAGSCLARNTRDG